ncbi:MAG: hypothetical protein GF330_11675 [Candidatus Eisenbacteria bacterium]|nr:hypothetical protein [Candidatus Eisenbacteria bacterium]
MMQRQPEQKPRRTRRMPTAEPVADRLREPSRLRGATEGRGAAVWRVAAVWRLAAGLLVVAAALHTAAQAGTLLDRLGLDSVYQSRYEVTRRETEWRQSLDLDRGTDLSNLSAKLQSKNREDESRNDFEEALSRIDVRYGRTLSFGEAFLDGRSRRHWTQTSRSRTDIEENTFDLGQNLPLLQRESGGIGLDLRGGWIQEKEVRQQFRRGLIVDSTLATGWSGQAELRGAWEPDATLSWNSRISFDGSLQSSSSIHNERDEEGILTDTEQLEATDHAQDLSARSDLVWARYEALKVAISTSLTEGFTQFYQPTQRAQETQSISRRSNSLNLEGQLGTLLGYGVDYSNDVTEFDYDVQDKDRLDRDQRVLLRGSHDLTLPILRGATVKASAGFSSGRRSLQNTTAYDTRGKSLEGELQKQFGEQITMGLRMLVDLTQDFYDDGSLDRDQLRTDVALAAAYTPSQRFTATLGYTTNNREVVNIAADRASQNQKRENYQITAGYTATLLEALSLRQNFLIGADYTYYVFNEDENTLTRTNRVTTKVDAGLWKRAGLRLEHIFHRTDSGAYRYPEGGGTRAYTKSSDRLRQYIKAEVDFDLSRAIRLRATETYDLNYRTSLANDQTTLRDKLTFSGFVGVQHEFSGGLTVRSSFEHTSSTQEDDFWNILAEVQKRFE